MTLIKGVMCMTINQLQALLQMSTGLNDHLFELREHYPENSPLLQTDQEL